jgi:hypothetical protein
MIPELRHTYNSAFSNERYQEMLAAIEQQLPGQLEFRLAETPVFVPAILRDKLISAGESIVDVVRQDNFSQLTEAAIPPAQRVPGPEGRPEFLTFDFAVCRDGNGELEPQLIEMQGLPVALRVSVLVARAVRPVLPHFRCRFGVPGNAVCGRLPGRDARVSVGR